MAEDIGRALEALVRREIEAALRRLGIGNTLVRGRENRRVREDIPYAESGTYLRCPHCGHEVGLSESWSSSSFEGEATGHAVSGEGATVGRATTRYVGRSRSITESEATTEGGSETEGEDVPGPDKPA